MCHISCVVSVLYKIGKLLMKCQKTGFPIIPIHCHLGLHHAKVKNRYDSKPSSRAHRHKIKDKKGK